MKVRIEILNEKKLIGKSLKMSFTNNKTGLLWGSFMPFRKEIINRINNDKFSLQIFGEGYFEEFNPNTEFEKWALIEVTDFSNIPEGMETFVLESGLYAVFGHKGTSTDIFQNIYSNWIPNSVYLLDNRPHFEVLGEKYQKDSEESEEEIWIPIKPKIATNSTLAI